MKKTTMLFSVVFILFVSNFVFAAAQVRNVSITGGCYTSGQNITISFEVRCAAYQATFGDILFSVNSTAEYTDDAVWTSAGPQDPPDNDGHDGGSIQSQGSDANTWFTKSYTVKVPSGYSGTRYIIVNVAENYMQLFQFSQHVENSASAAMTRCASPTPTRTRTATLLPTKTRTPTRTATLLSTTTRTLTRTMTFTATSTPTLLPIGTHTMPKTLHVEYKNGSIQPGVINPLIRIYNDSNEPVNVNGMEVKYWYKFDSIPQAEIASIVSAVIQNSVPVDITLQSNGTVVNQIRGDQDRYLKITFNSPSGYIEPGRYIEVQSTVRMADNKFYNPSNDWSYNGTFRTFSPWGRIVVTVPGVGTFGSNPWMRNSPMSIRVDCGNPIFDYTDSMSHIWEADRPYTPGGWGWAGIDEYWNPGLSVAGTTDNDLYNTMSDHQMGNFSYLFDIPNGNYQVTLKFAEPIYHSINQRIFSVNMEGSVVISNLDLYASTGYSTAYDRTFVVTVADRQLNIDFLSINDSAIISAIEILEIVPPPTPTPSLSPTPCFIASWGSPGNGNSQFTNPTGIFADNSGNIYVVDSGNNRIQKFDSSGTYIAQFGSYGSGNGQFFSPGEIAIDASGNIYVVDSFNNRVQKFDSSGIYISQFGSYGTGDGQFISPNGIAIDSVGNIFIVDTGNHRIQKFDGSGTYVAQFGGYGNGNGQFYFPMGIAIDNAGNIYITDSNNYRIQKFTSGLIYTAQWGSQGSGVGQFFGRPLDMAIDGSGNIYVVDVNNTIKEFTSSGIPVTQWGEPGTGDGQFYYPWGISKDNSGYFYITDSNNNRIEKFGPCPTPVPTCSADKDCAINWLHVQQWTELADLTAYPSDWEYGSWPYANTANKGAANVGITALTVLGFINEFNYDYFKDFPANTTANFVTNANCWGVTVDKCDPSITLGIEYILRNADKTTGEGFISDVTHPEGREVTKTYDTSLALAALCAYRQILKANPGWYRPISMDEIEQAMQNAYEYLLNAQCIPVGTFPAGKKKSVNDDNGVYDINSQEFGGWGYPRNNWADMSNTQFAVWALKTMEVATSLYPLTASLTTPPWNFPAERQAYAGRFIMQSSYDPSTLGTRTQFVPGIGNVPDITIPANRSDLGAVTTSNGGLYKTGYLRDAYNNGNPYGSITAASLWADFCVGAQWGPVSFLSSISAWNSILWFGTNYSAAGDPGGPPLPASQWYYYYIMTLAKSLSMNIIPFTQFPGAGASGWNGDIQAHLVNYLNKPAHLDNYPCTYFWSNIPPFNDPEEVDVFDTACGVLGMETVLQCAIADYSTLRILLESPAQVYVIDGQGRRAGCVNGMTVTEIPGSSVPSCEEVLISGTKDGQYKIRVKGISNGRYHINVESYISGGLMQKERGVNDINAGQEQEWNVNLGRVFWPGTISTDFKKDLLEIAYKPGQTDAITNNPKPYFRAYNNGTKDISLVGTTLRYWYSYEGTGQPETASVISSLVSTGQNLTVATHAAIKTLASVSGTNRYMEISFLTNGTVLKPGQYIDIQAEFHKADMSAYDQSNDYSFRVTPDYQLWNHITGYLTGNPAWGIEPSLIFATPTVTLTITPTRTGTPPTPYPVPTLEITVNPNTAPPYVAYGPTPIVLPVDQQFGSPFLTVRYYFPFDTNPSGPFVFYFHMDHALEPVFNLTTDGSSGPCTIITDGKSVTATCSDLFPPYFMQFFFIPKKATGIPAGIYHNYAYIAPDLTAVPQTVNMNFEIDVLALTATDTSTVTPSMTVSPTFTDTGTITATSTITETGTETAVVSPVDTGTITETYTVTETRTATNTFTSTCTSTPTYSVTPTATPTNTAVLDSYEPDNTYLEAKNITNGMQQVHSIDPPGDVDWVKFDLTNRSDVILETSGPANDDTVIWLYNSAGVPGTFLIMDDDGGLGNFSKITATLDPGTYYLKVNAYSPNNTIQTYYLNLTVNALPTATPTMTFTPTFTITPTATQTVSETLTMTMTPTALPAANLRAQYFSYHTESTYNTIYVNVRIYNDGTENANLQDVTSKYWYTFEGSGAEAVEIDDAHKLPSGQDIKLFTTAEIQTISQSGQDRVQITSFGPGAGSIATGEFAELHLRVHKADWTNYTQTNDYSFGTQTEFQNWQQVTLYFGGTKVWGLEPGETGLLSLTKSTPTPGRAEPLSNNNTYNYPNPCNGRTSIRFSLEKPVDTNITIYDIAGILVWTKVLRASETRAGINIIAWDVINDSGVDAANGVYILKISADGKLATKKIAVVR